MAEKSPRFAGARLQSFVSNGSQFVGPEGPPERIVVRTTAVLERAYKPSGVTDSSGHQVGGLTHHRGMSILNLHPETSQ